MTGNTMKVLLVGCGDIGVPLGLTLVNDGAEVWGLRRDSSTLPPGIHPISADVCDPASLSPLDKLSFDYVVITLVPAAFDDEGYRRIFVEGMGHIADRLARQTTLKRVLLVSSTSVYGQSEGEWVDEHSATEPGRYSGQRLLQGETLMRDSGVPLTVVRFAGIYGPGRRRLISQVQQGKGCAESPPLYSNRIHRDDCVGFLRHLIDSDRVGQPLLPLYLGVDNEPAPLWEVKRWLATALGQDPDQLQASDAGARRSSKRCRNGALRASGYQLQFPSYRDGYSALLSDQLSQ